MILENIRLTDAAMQSRLGTAPVGFRTPGGSLTGLIGRPDLQQMLLEYGYQWVSSMAKAVPVKPSQPTEDDFQRVADAQRESQPFVYPSGLIEIPMSPLGDVAAFRRKEEKWSLGDFLAMIERAVSRVIEERAVFDLLGHPSIMQVEDPQFRTYELICRLVKQAGDRSADRGPRNHRPPRPTPASSWSGNRLMGFQKEITQRRRGRREASNGSCRDSRRLGRAAGRGARHPGILCGRYLGKSLAGTHPQREIRP